MEAVLDVDGNAVFYADDSSLWVIGSTVAEVRDKLEEKAALFSAYVEGNGLVLNASKSQLLFSKGADITDVFVDVNGCRVVPSPSLDLLGVEFDRAFSTTLHSASVAAAAKQRAGVIARLSHHLPRGRYLSQLAQGLLVGKLGHALPAVATPRLQGCGSSGSTFAKATQVAINDTCRTLTGTRRKDRKIVEDLLSSARLPSLNELVVTATATEAWKAFSSRDGGAGERNPVGVLIFGPRDVAPNARTTRSVVAGQVPIALRGQETFITHAAEIWNHSAELRVAKTIGEAKRAAKLLAKSAPL